MIPIGAEMTEFNLILLQKTELQHRGNSILTAFLGFPSTWRAQNDMFRWKYFRCKIAISDPGETRVMQKTYIQKL